MFSSPILPGLLAFALLAGGALLIVQLVRERRKVITARVSLVAPPSPAPDAREKAAARADAALLRVSVRGLHDSDLAQIAHICARLGIRAGNASLAFAVARLACGAMCAGMALIGLGMLDTAGPLVTLGALALAPAGVMIGWFAPLLIVRRMAKGRATAVSGGLPEALELLVICVEAGLALEDGLDRITVEIRATQPALAQELEVTSADLKILLDRDEAFRKLAQRVDSPGIRSVVTTLSQTLRYGTPLSNALRVAAAELRSDALIALEERSNRLPSLMTLPMMLFIMPTIFLIVGGPVVLRMMDVFAR
ncbi:type II secretion system F family protein [Sphingobium nicotianae]|uniref:Type II secretion system F family protein n=1 Tax=Sphingobium nicotianae TaxID=2782607 RepID=A0A9X1ISY5_9SPHN|nr:type II secretion system F family protein [Sphingobium nicotianae]MBT2189076.1 type II secretion system F family protein [Sphingobium nicotianae]